MAAHGLLSLVFVPILAGCGAGPAEHRAASAPPHAASEAADALQAPAPSPTSPVASCTAAPDMGRYALPTWVLLGRSSPSETWAVSATTDALDRQLAAADAASPDRPRLLLEAAEGHLRLAEESGATPDASASARAQAIRLLATRVQFHPDAPETDTTLYLLGWSLQQAAQLDRARVVYLKLIRDYPASRWIPYAYLAFADYYFAEGELDAASRFYEKVLELANPDNHLAPFALYRLAAATSRLEQYAEARARHTELARVLREDPAIPDGAALRAAAERDSCGLSALPAAVPASWR